MNTFFIIILLLSCFIALILAWFAVSSCLGDEIRAAWSGRKTATMPTTYGLQYARHVNQGGALENIEMENMLDQRLLSDEEN